MNPGTQVLTISKLTKRYPGATFDALHDVSLTIPTAQVFGFLGPNGAGKVALDGALTGRRGIAGTIIGLFAFASFMVSSLAPGISALKYIDLVSPFHYYNKPSPLEAGLQTTDASVLAAASVVCLLVGLWIFMRRDIYR
ncbi:MAG TPA: hypothetical protein VFB59_03290 [Candidatus Saccharimonadales bacterium]|nr:hypothetical protein [Candidatus Saccharimonadales bacterium]